MTNQFGCSEAPMNYQTRPNLNQTFPIEDIWAKFFEHILDWDPSWLDDKKYDNVPPPRINKMRMVPAPLQYSYIEEYQHVMFPMLVHEFWHVIKQNYDEFPRVKRDAVIYANQLTGKTLKESLFLCGKRTIYSVKFTVRNKKNFSYKNYEGLRRGDLVKISFHQSNNWNNPYEYQRYGENTGVYSCQVSTVFGYLVNFYPSGDAHTYELITTASAKSLQQGFSLTTVSSILGYLGLIHTLESLRKFPLCEPVLYLKVESCTMPSINTQLHSSEVAIEGNLNTSQIKVILGIKEVIRQNQPRICLVQGPPGTGKTKTIINIIASILKMNSGTQILVCAPSNKAIDSVILRLKDIESMLAEQNVPLRIVRIGEEDKIDNSVLDLALSQQALKYYSKKSNHLFIKKQKTILKQANVIASTLASCYTSNTMTKVFGYGKNRPPLRICIVDEAAQATELLTLVPAWLGVDKLILVGDPQQLPSITLSQTAKDHGYDRSLFARVQKVFAEEEINPIVMLDTQYRMVNAISQWPNRYFYRGFIKDAALVKPLGICNYKLFNHEFPQDEDGHANRQEAILIIKLVNVLRKKLEMKTPNDNISIGIITPYNKQRQVIFNMLNWKLPATQLMESLENEDLKTTKMIEVNTVDSFQGSERDIIIMSCVRSSGIGFTEDPNRLCVSLTRAKHTLIMFGNFKAFAGNDMWKSLIKDAVERDSFVNIGDSDAEYIFNEHVIQECPRERLLPGPM